MGKADGIVRPNALIDKRHALPKPVPRLGIAHVDLFHLGALRCVRGDGVDLLFDGGKDARDDGRDELGVEKLRAEDLRHGRRNLTFDLCPLPEPGDVLGHVKLEAGARRPRRCARVQCESDGKKTDDYCKTRPSLHPHRRHGWDGSSSPAATLHTRRSYLRSFPCPAGHPAVRGCPIPPDRGVWARRGARVGGGPSEYAARSRCLERRPTREVIG